MGRLGQSLTSVARFTAVVLAAILSLAVIGLTVWLVLPTPLAVRAEEVALRTLLGKDQAAWCRYGWTGALPGAGTLCSPVEDADTRDEARNALNRDHRTVELWVDRCIGPPAAGETLDPSNGYSARQWDNLNQQRATAGMLFLSGRLADDRVTHARAARRAERSLARWTWATVLLGLITTVLVALGSTEFGRGDTAAARWIRASAVAFTAVGTSAAALMAFYAPREELARADLDLSGARPLHEQMANSLWNVTCPGKQPETSEAVEASAHLKELTDRYRAMRTARESSGRSGASAGQAGTQPVRLPSTPADKP